MLKMSFLEAMRAYLKQEIEAAKLILTLGLLCLGVVGFALAKGGNGHLIGLGFPIGIGGTSFVVAGVFMLKANPERIKRFTVEFKEDPKAFLFKERGRVDAFISWYPYLKLLWLSFVTLGLIAYLLFEADTWKGMGLGLGALGFMGYGIDHFSEQRAKNYQHYLNQAADKYVK